MPTFDIVNKINLEDFKNAIDAVNREILNRYDFKGSISKIIVEDDNYFILAESDMKINQLKDLLSKNLVRKNVNVKSFFEVFFILSSEIFFRRQSEIAATEINISHGNFDNVEVKKSFPLSTLITFIFFASSL